MDAFAREMNHEAKRLGMRDAHYENPHGLSDPDHLITAADLLKLGSVVMKQPRIREIVSTRQFGCRVESESGYSRNVRWKNTNRLLGIDGYLGVKTGTTRAAGACLVSMGDRGGDTADGRAYGHRGGAGGRADA